MDRETAQDIRDLMFDINSKLNRSLLDVRDKCSKEEYDGYRLSVARILADMLLEILNPLFDQHPDLEPEELRKSRGK